TGDAATPARSADGSLERHEALFFSGQTANARRREHHGRNTRSLFFLLELLHDAVGEYEGRVWLVPVARSHIPVLDRWARDDPELGRKLSGSYAEDPGWVGEVAEGEGRFGWIAVRGGEPVGFVDLDLLAGEDDGTGWLAFYVAPTFRSRGVGRRMLGLAAKEARAFGAYALLASVEGDNLASARCLAGAGFEGLGRVAGADLLFALDLAQRRA
ncbi:MAG: GNAT family N-acetyltransferase, partial [Actinomycetota bacterium]|nr:GNAT family N-acetyltransferase [Actinomycetota bacterium]